GLAGYRVAYADEAHSDAEMVSTERESRQQRSRWERGRFQLVRTKTLPLLRRALSARSGVCLDLAFDLMVLPLSYVALDVVALFGLAAVALSSSRAFAPWLWVGVLCVVALLLHILRGWQLSGAGVRGLLDLLRAPFFMLWKILVLIGDRAPKE